MKPNELPSVNFPLGRIIAKAPLGILGAFIQHKLREYVEPTREGTPKGQPVGLSRQKYHAALLAELTSLDLKVIAREAKVSYALLRKWRTEDAFIDAGYDAAQEFAEHWFDHAAKLTLRYLFNQGDTITAPQEIATLVSDMKERKLFGFDDGHLYSRSLLHFTIDQKHAHFKTIIDALSPLKPGEALDEKTMILVGDYLSWTYCLDRIGGMKEPKPGTKEHAAFQSQQREDQLFLAVMAANALKHVPAHPALQYVARSASFVQGCLFRS